MIIHPLAVRAMAQIGIDIGTQRSKLLREFLGTVPVHHLVIVCSPAETDCPKIWPGVLTRTEHLVKDPAAVAAFDEERLVVLNLVEVDVFTAPVCSRHSTESWLTQHPENFVR